MKLTASAVVAAVAFIGASPGQSAPDEYFTGLHGTVGVWPWKCLTRAPCAAPGVAGITLTFSRDGNEVARLTTGTQGGYAVVLDPGRYTVSAPHRGMGGRGIIRYPVTVIAGRLLHRDLQYDAGIR